MSLDSRPLLQHRLAVGSANVVEVDVHGEAWQTEQEEVQGRSPLQGDSAFQEGVAAQRIQQVDEPEYLLEGVGLEPGLRREACELRRGELHAGSSHRRSSRDSGTTRFQRESRVPELRRPSR